MNHLTPPTLPTSSSRMKKTLLYLCFVLLIVIVFFYSQTKSNEILPGPTLKVNPDTKNQQNDKALPASSTSTVVTTIETTTLTKKNVLPASLNRRFAIYACSIHASTFAYTFYTPLTAASWKRVGYDSIVVFVGDFKKPNVMTPRLNLTRVYLKQVGAHIVDVQCNESYSIKLSQLVRVFSGFLPDTIVQDDDNILSGDSDLIPLKPSEYLPSANTDGFIFNAFCCGSFQRRGRSYQMFPMGHIFLQKKVWKSMVLESKQRAELLSNADDKTRALLSENAPLSFEMISLYGRHEFKDVYDQRMDKGDAAWYMDQVLCSMMLIDYRESHKNLNISERGRIDRLDRAYGMEFWNRDNFDQFGDAHLKHDEILQEGNWKIFNRLLKSLFNETTVTFFNDYYQKYMIIDKLPQK